MRKTAKISMSGILAALSVSLLFAGSVSVIFDYTMLAAASFMTAVAVIELGAGWAVCVYAATALVSLMILPQREIAVLYIVALGYYPVLKLYIERLGSKTLRVVLKLTAFNIAILAVVMLMRGLFMPSADIMAYGRIYMWSFYAIVNVVFVLYDVALTRVAAYYIYRIRPRLRAGRD